MTKLTLSAEQQAVLKGLTEDERKAYDGLETDAVRVAWLGALVGLDEDNAELDKQIETRVVDEGDDRRKYPIFRPGEGPLREGRRLVARFLGTVPMFSDKPKENWAEKVFHGKTWYFNYHYLFARKDGTLFGTFDSPMLRPLRKVFTNYSYECQVAEGLAPVRRVTKDPAVKIEYVGKLEGKEKIKELFPNFEMQRGNAVHGYRLELEEDATTANRYSRGIVNLTDNPVPSAPSSTGEKLDTVDVAANSWAALMGENRTQPDGSDTRQLNHETGAVAQ